MESVLEQLRKALKDRYRVDDEIGRGGMATVFRAQDLRYDRPVAIKVLSPDISSVVSAERFTREIRISAKLSHPNILTVFDSGEVGELLYYVMTYVEGESLRARMKRETYLPMEDAIRITCEVADALSYAHEQGVIHRDIKPENILLRAGHVLVADFGIARLSEGEGEGATLTAVGMSVGTAAYMSPEQSAGDPVTPRSDIYSLGTTLYEMLAGQLPFTGPNPMAIAARRMMEPVPPIRIVRPAVPEQLEAVVMCSMERVAADRFQSMDDFKRAILGEAGTMSMTASRYTPLYMTSTRMTPAQEQTNRRRKLMIGGGIGALVLALAVAGVMFFRKGGSTPAAASADAKNVAVLYFDDASNGSLRYLADGLTESLIDRLSTVSALNVISKDGVRMFRGQDVGADSVAKVLQVGTIVRGSLEPAGGKVKLTIQLRTAEDALIARKSFDVDTARIVTSQIELATNVGDFLRENLGAEIRMRDERAATTNSQAWTLVERAGKLRKDADSLGAQGSTDAALAAIARADSLLAAAQRLDTQWVKIPVLRASAMYAKAYLQTRQSSQMAATIDDGLAHAEQALRLQPNSSDALEIKGQLLYLRYARRVDTDPSKVDRLLPEAESNLKKAVDLNKDQAGAWATLSLLYYAKPDIQAANSAALNAFRADAYLASAKPILKRLFWTSHDLEQFPEALDWCDEGRRRFPTDPDFVSCRLWMYTTRREAKPDIDSAWIYRNQFVALTPEKLRPNKQKLGDILVAGAIARAGLPDSARHVLLRARATPEEDPSRELEGNEAVIRVILGDQDEAVRLIADYLTANPGHRKGFATRTGWWWRDIQGNPKFKALIAGAR